VSDKGIVDRKSNKFNLTAEAYAQALYKDGIRKGWIRKDLTDRPPGHAERVLFSLYVPLFSPQPADEAAKILGVKSRTEAVHVALREIVALKKLKNLMTKHAGRLGFEAIGE
jgi:hypothetical protein